MVQAARVEQGLGLWEKDPVNSGRSDLMTCCFCVVTPPTGWRRIQARGGLSGELLPDSRRKVMESGQDDGVWTRALDTGD